MNGKQYLVIAAGGHGKWARSKAILWVAFTLP